MQKIDSLLWRKAFAVFFALYIFTVGGFAQASDIEMEPNNKVSTAQAITPGRPLTGTISTLEDVDIYAIRTFRSRKVRAEFLGLEK